MDSQSLVPLSTLKRGEKAYVVDLALNGLFRRRLLDLGIVPGTSLKCLGSAPAGDPIAYLVRGTVIALRSEDAQAIRVNSTLV
ncbi:Fe2+ transport system protein A [Desulfitobacterium dichloroeliminans LMG P-21439]|uniref:Fe2+ transport system protein A n=1 Tax=Desulfitobacterium dichloroeliminans (strain LMG P-21439 / DCA1) TaxID=871963 RepID=L0F8E3_DESDL|nr:FeoA family protein [Desulfitobacterium dichloroeliminans]AGA70074.1 Fe2+ transport system protein A [Desulfitobacterium dichloroeliminans LMG P-21439]